jgi:PiT family inorganic phosphate transporter
VIATRVLAPTVAIVLAATLNLIGATQISAVAHTITSGLIDPKAASQWVVLCAIIGAISWNVFTWYFGIPSSSSYALIGGLIGSTWIASGFLSIFWKSVLFKVVIPMILSPIVGFFLGLIAMGSVVKYEKDPKKKKLFSRLQIGSASLVALSHGLNDAQKSMGIIALGLFTAGWIPFPYIPFWVILCCAIMMGLGTATGGFRIIRTVGYEITSLHPVQGFAAESSASCVILAASFLGMPVSSTHMIVGSVTGVGAAKGMGHVRWKVGKKLVTAWIFTLPGSGLIACFAYYLFQIL